MMEMPWMDRRTASLSGNAKKNGAGSGAPVGGDTSHILMPPPPVVPQASSTAAAQQKESVQVKLELGHKALVRKNPTPDGFTHDWTMFVRGPEGSNIQHFVDRVVFHLHDSFPKPRRIVKDPPYQINESGYAGFNLPIDIYFKNKEDPKKILFHYDLFLHVDGCPPVNHVRCEKLTFQNPSEEFRRKLIKAGGVGNLATVDHAPQQQPSAVTPPSSTQVTTPESKTYADLFEAPLKNDAGLKKPKSHSSKDRGPSRGKPGSSSAYSSSGGSVTPPPALTPPPTVPQSTPPTTPTKELRSAGSTPTKSKDKSSKRLAESTASSDVSKKKRKDLPSIVVEDVMKVREREERKERERERQREKEKEYEKEQEREKEKEERQKELEKEKKKERRSSSSKESKGKHRSSKKDGSKSKSDSTSPSSSKGSSKQVAAKSSPNRSGYGPPKRVSEGKVMPEKPPVIQDIIKLDDDLSMDDTSDGFDIESIDMDVQIPDLIGRVGSPASTLSFSSVKGTSAGGSGPLSALLAEMDDDEDLLSPLSKNSPAPHFSPPSLTQVIHESVSMMDQNPEPRPLGLTASKESSLSPPQLKPSSGGKTKKKDKESRKSKSEKRTKEQRNHKNSKESSKENKETNVFHDNSQIDSVCKDLFRDFADGKGKDSSAELHMEASKETSRDLVERDLNNPTAPNGESLNVLLELQKRLMSMTDRDLLQQVVNVIEETGMYKISDATFDFDLCCLDITTVKKLQVCLEMTC